jgi:long-chain acyl-CoA synthetase
VICQLDGVAEAAVAGRPHPIMGSVVCAKIRMDDPNIPVPEVRARIRRLLVARLEPFKIPQKIEITSQKLTTARFKQAR